MKGNSIFPFFWVGSKMAEEGGRKWSSFWLQLWEFFSKSFLPFYTFFTPSQFYSLNQTLFCFACMFQTLFCIVFCFEKSVLFLRVWCTHLVLQMCFTNCFRFQFTLFVSVSVKAFDFQGPGRPWMLCWHFPQSHRSIILFFDKTVSLVIPVSCFVSGICFDLSHA